MKKRKLNSKNPRYSKKKEKEWIEALTERGYKAEICKGLPAILELIDWYFEKDK